MQATDYTYNQLIMVFGFQLSSVIIKLLTNMFLIIVACKTLCNVEILKPLYDNIQT